MNPIGSILLAVSILTGLWVLGFETWSVPYKLNLVFHPLVSVAAAVAIALSAHRGALSDIGKRDAAASAAWGLVATTLALFLRRVTGSPVIDVLLIGGLWIARYRRRPQQFSRFLSETVIYLFTAITVTGLAFAFMGGGRPAAPILLLHRSTSLALVCVLALRLAVTIRDTRNGTQPTAFNAEKRGILAASIAAVALIALIAIFEWTQSSRDPYYRFHLSTFSLEKRGILEQDLHPENFNRPELATKTNSCGGAVGCHPNPVSDLAVSAHGRSMHSRYMQKNMELLAEEIGEHNQVICGGCHYSRMMFETDRPISDSYTEVNYACTFCHLISDVALLDDRRKSEIGVTLPVAHLDMFDHEGQDAISGWNLRLINLNPFGHGRVFSKALYRKNEYCQVCHRLQIASTPETALTAPLCIDCHMQPRNLLGLEGSERNHIMLGTNTALPDDLQDKAGVELVRRYASGDLFVPIKGWGSFWEPRDRRTRPSIWVHQKALPVSEPSPGDPFTLRIITINASIDHAFPGGPLDLIEAWQHVVITDQDGTEVFRIGDLDEHFRIDPAAHRMGGKMIGEDGLPVDRNRVWQIKEKIVERAISFHNSTFDDYTFSLPESATSLRIESRWLYRKLNQEFVDWAYPGEGRTVPILVASELSDVIPLY